MLYVLAADMGSSSGRIFGGAYDGEHIKTWEVYRFLNRPFEENGEWFWDFFMLWNEFKNGLVLAGKQGHEFMSLGVDTWGLDFALVGDSGRLLQMPIHHRNPDNAHGMNWVLGRIPGEKLHQRTGIHLSQVNSIFQLGLICMRKRHFLESAKHFMMLPDLFHYYLTGIVATEYSIASTTQLFHALNKQWDFDLISELGIPSSVFPRIVSSGTQLGTCSLLEHAKVIAVATHDTASAVLGIPAAKNDSYAFISCGSWSLAGTEVSEPIINEKTLEYNMSNEEGPLNRVLLQKNMTGLWLMQQLREAWRAEGLQVSLEQFLVQAQKADPFRSLINPNDVLFMLPGNMPEKIRKWCVLHHQAVPDGPSEMARCILESLAMSYRLAVEQLEDVIGHSLPVIHMVGGGAMNHLLCQWTADATGKLVIAGPVEATSLGNLLMQLGTLGELNGIEEIRQVAQISTEVTIYEPRRHGEWTERYGGYVQLC